ncbi:hypothetical protein A7A76_19325 [Lysobacter enzymogenes]|uniref:acyltransferase family protein n=1 Tax=Lysobacter enzymogenes TaxID=69 RepID=UPI0019D2374E|nr:acyltransferase family protein [Lysobacter enzymogenes]MBN7136895.1 hypothetical protein [Lysobacter enzymogenes]
MTFRGDIEGLRGIAIALVVLAHAGVPGFGGGFIGVDVFFVISGYLITGQLLGELQARARIDFWAFFERRLRRLAPAMLAMLAATVALASLLLPGFALDGQLQAAGWAAVWLSNIHFMGADFGYFESGAAENLFLHTWSLGVEEQFYLLWPAAIALAWKAGLRSWKYFAGVAVLGFAVCLAVGRWDPMAAYYSMPTRLWQLAAGACVYVYAGPQGSGRRVVAWLGAALLVVGLCLIGPDSAYPGVSAVLPTLGAGLLLLGGREAAALQWRPLRFLGRVSYGWYLWHWPLLAMLPAMSLGTPSPAERAALVLASLLLAWASSVWLEEPIRRRRSARARPTVLAGVLGLLVVAVGLKLSMAPALEPMSTARVPQTFEQKVRARITLPKLYERPECDQWFKGSAVVPCQLGQARPGDGLMVLLADSVGADWSPALEAVAQRNGLRFMVITKSACLIADQPFVYERIKRRYVECERWRAGAIQAIARLRPDVVVIGSSQGYPLDAQQWQDGTVAVLRPLAAAANKVLVLMPTPMLPFNAPACVATRGREEDGGRLSAPDCAARLDEIERKDIEQALGAAVARVPGARLVNLNDLLCLNGVCSAVVDGQLAYRDAQHLNAAYVESLSGALAQRLAPLLAASQDTQPGPSPSNRQRTSN